MELEVKRRTTESLILKLSSVSDQTRIASLCELRLLTKTDPDIRPIIADQDDGAAITLLAESLYSPTHLAQENAAATLLNLSISCKGSIMSTRGVLDSLSYTLSNHRTTPPAAVQSVAATVYSLCVDESYRSIIGGKRDVVYSLIDIVGCRDSPPRSIKDGLKALFGLSLHPPNRPLLVAFGAVGALFRAVVGPGHDGRHGQARLGGPGYPGLGTGPDLELRIGPVGVVEDATAVIAQVAGCWESVEAFREVGGVRVMVELLNPETGSSSRIKENVVSGLLNLVKIGGVEVGEEIREVGLGLVFDGLGEVVDSGSDKGKKRAQALMKILEDGMSLKDSNDSGSDLYSNSLIDNLNSFSY